MSAFRAVASVAILSAFAASVVSAAYVSPVMRDIAYPKCYDISKKCDYYDVKKEIGCCAKGASCVSYKEKGAGKYCFKYDDYYYHDAARDESYCYAYDGTKVVRGKKGDDYEYYSWEDDYTVKVIYDEDYYKDLSKYYDDDGGKYWYSDKGEKKYVEEYYEEDYGVSCFYDEYGAKVYNYFYYSYDGKTYCYGKDGQILYIAGDEAYYYVKEGEKDKKVYVDISDYKEYWEDDEGVYKYTVSKKEPKKAIKYYLFVYEPTYVEKHAYYSEKKKTTYKPKVVSKKKYYEEKSYYTPSSYETKYDYESAYYGKKEKPGTFIPKPKVSPDVWGSGGQTGGSSSGGSTGSTGGSTGSTGGSSANFGDPAFGSSDFSGGSF